MEYKEDGACEAAPHLPSLKQYLTGDGWVVATGRDLVSSGLWDELVGALRSSPRWFSKLRCTDLTPFREAYEEFWTALGANTSLMHLAVHDSDLNAAADDIGQALETNTALISLNLGNNRLGSEGGVAIAKALETNTALASLNLENNRLGSEAGVAIAKALETNTALASLNLERTWLGSEGGVAIAKALETNTALASLNLERNDVGSEGGVAIAKALETNTALASLNLGYNDIRGNDAFVKALKVNSAVTVEGLRDGVGTSVPAVCVCAGGSRESVTSALCSVRAAHAACLGIYEDAGLVGPDVDVVRVAALRVYAHRHTGGQAARTACLRVLLDRGVPVDPCLNEAPCVVALHMTDLLPTPYTPSQAVVDDAFARDCVDFFTFLIDRSKQRRGSLATLTDLLAEAKARNAHRVRRLLEEQLVVKAMVLGYGLAGKSQLVRALEQQPSWFGSTHVPKIDYSREATTASTSHLIPLQSVVVDVLDTPGQPDFYASNCFLLEQLSSCLVMACLRATVPRADRDDSASAVKTKSFERLYAAACHWLSLVCGYAASHQQGRVQVVLVCTCVDEIPGSAARDAFVSRCLPRLFKAVSDVYSSRLDLGSGIVPVSGLWRDRGVFSSGPTVEPLVEVLESRAAPMRAARLSVLDVGTAALSARLRSFMTPSSQFSPAQLSQLLRSGLCLQVPSILQGSASVVTNVNMFMDLVSWVVNPFLKQAPAGSLVHALTDDGCPVPGLDDAVLLETALDSSLEAFVQRTKCDASVTALKDVLLGADLVYPVGRLHPTGEWLFLVPSHLHRHGHDRMHRIHQSDGESGDPIRSDDAVTVFYDFGDGKRSALAPGQNGICGVRVFALRERQVVRGASSRGHLSVLPVALMYRMLFLLLQYDMSLHRSRFHPECEVRRHSVRVTLYSGHSIFLHFGNQHHVSEFAFVDVVVWGPADAALGRCLRYCVELLSALMQTGGEGGAVHIQSMLRRVLGQENGAPSPVNEVKVASSTAPAPTRDTAPDTALTSPRPDLHAFWHDIRFECIRVSRHCAHCLRAALHTGAWTALGPNNPREQPDLPQSAAAYTNRHHPFYMTEQDCGACRQCTPSALRRAYEQARPHAVSASTEFPFVVCDGVMQYRHHGQMRPGERFILTDSLKAVASRTTPPAAFLSHRGPDTKYQVVRALKFMMDALEVPVFFDQNMDVGTVNAEQMALAACRCRVGVVFVSSGFLDSKWCVRELNTFLRRRAESPDDFTLVPVYYDSHLLGSSDYKAMGSLVGLERERGVNDRHLLVNKVVPRLLKLLRPELRHTPGQLHSLIDDYIRASEGVVTVGPGLYAPNKTPQTTEAMDEAEQRPGAALLRHLASQHRSVREPFVFAQCLIGDTYVVARAADFPGAARQVWSVRAGEQLRLCVSVAPHPDALYPVPAVSATLSGVHVDYHCRGGTHSDEVKAAEQPTELRRPSAGGPQWWRGSFAVDLSSWVQLVQGATTYSSALVTLHLRLSCDAHIMHRTLRLKVSDKPSPGDRSTPAGQTKAEATWEALPPPMRLRLQDVSGELEAAVLLPW